VNIEGSDESAMWLDRGSVMVELEAATFPANCPTYRLDDREFDIALGNISGDHLTLYHDAQGLRRVAVGAMLERGGVGARQVHQQAKHLDHIWRSDAFFLQGNDVSILQSNLERL